jgi:hypothetical protein
MAQIEVTKEEIMAVYPKVAETMADALGCDVDQVKLDVSLIEGLDAESIDSASRPSISDTSSLTSATSQPSASAMVSATLG